MDNFKKLRITELEGTIQDKDFEISDLNEACTSQLTQIEENIDSTINFPFKKVRT